MLWQEKEEGINAGKLTNKDSQYWNGTPLLWVRVAPLQGIKEYSNRAHEELNLVLCIAGPGETADWAVIFIIIINHTHPLVKLFILISSLRGLRRFNFLISSQMALLFLLSDLYSSPVPWIKTITKVLHIACTPLPSSPLLFPRPRPCLFSWCHSPGFNDHNLKWPWL